MDAYCKSCIFDDKSGLGTWRQQVQGCTIPECPLYDVRPVSQPKRLQNEPRQPIPEGLRRYKEQKDKEAGK